MHVLKLILISSIALLSACASQLSSNSFNQPPLQKNQGTISSPETLHLTGRFSVHVSPNNVQNEHNKYDEQNQNNSLHGGFDWVQSNHLDPTYTPENTKVTLLSPFKQTLAVIEVTPQIATLTQAGEPPQSAANADILAANILGWPLPISGLRHWLQGNTLNTDGSHFTANPDNNLVTTQDGWRIHYINWEQDENAINTKLYQPKRIDLTRMIPAIGKVTIRIMIDSRQ